MEKAGGSPLVASAMDSRLLQGQLIGDKYRVSHLLGEGGMASVWAGSNERTGKLVALKVIRRSFMATPGADAFLHTEGLAASRVNHPNVVTVFDLIEHEGMACIVMELLNGVSLGTYSARRGPLSLHDTVGILLPAMRGVAAAHAQGVIHRDLKPQNIFVCVDDDGRVVTTKVLDFGISVMMDWARGKSVTAVPGLVGTPSYIAPENIEGETGLDPRTDVYGFGLLLYETLAGVPAFPASLGVDEVLQRVLTEAPVPLRELRPDLPMGMLGIVETAMAKSPSQRFESLNQMMAVIEEQIAPASSAGGKAVPGSLMSYTVSGPLMVGIPTHVARESSEPYATQNYGHARKEGEKTAPPLLTSEGSSLLPNASVATTSSPPTVLLARSVLSRAVRDVGNFHYLRSLRERRRLWILVPSSVALIIFLAVWGIARGRGPSPKAKPAPALGRPATDSPLSAGGGGGVANRPVEDSPSPGALMSEPGAPSIPAPFVVPQAGDKGLGVRPADRGTPGKRVKSKAKANSEPGRAGILRVEDF